MFENFSLVPCIMTRFWVKEIGEKEMFHRKKVSLFFEKEVGITQSEFKTGFGGLISKIGGFIGISKNFLWLLILLITSMSIIMSKFKANEVK